MIRIISKKDILIIIILFFVSTFIWIGSNIYHTSVSSTISEDTSKEIAPINSNFDTGTINELKSRGKILPIYDLQSPSPTQPEASQGGNLML